MAKKGLRAWVGENWVDIANKKSDGSYPKCVPAAKARGMSKGQKASAVARKNKAEAGGRRADKKPNRAATFAKRKKASTGGLMDYYRGML